VEAHHGEPVVERGGAFDSKNHPLGGKRGTKMSQGGGVRPNQITEKKKGGFVRKLTNKCSPKEEKNRRAVGGPRHGKEGKTPENSYR